MSSLPFLYTCSPLSRISSSSTQDTQSIHPSKIREARERKMSIARTYALARTARAKLSTEASKQDHDLRLLVGHANMLDSLMLSLAEAEREHEEWFDEAIRGNMAEDEDYEEEDSSNWGHGGEPQQWLAVDYDSESDSDESDEDEDEMDYEYDMPHKPSHSLTMQYQTIIGVTEVPEVDEDSEDEDGLYTLTRTSSHRPPQLVEDMSDDEDEESTPPSPPQVLLPTFPKEDEHSISTSGFFGPLPQPPRLPSKQSEEYFHSDYHQRAPVIHSY